MSFVSDCAVPSSLCGAARLARARVGVGEGRGLNQNMGDSPGLMRLLISHGYERFSGWRVEFD